MSKESVAVLPKEPIQDLAQFEETILRCRQSYNILSPIVKVDRLLPMHGLALAKVNLSASPEDGDIWHDKRWKDDEFALTHVALNKLFVAAGGTWLHENCGRVDDRTEPFLVEWTCVGRMKDPTGALVEAAATKRVDLRGGSPEVKGWTEDRLNEARKFVLEYAESKAQNRVVRKLLGIKAKYKKAEISRPFVVVRSVPMLDMSNPAVADAVTRFALGGTDALYGPARQEPIRQIDHIEARPVAEIPAHLANDDDEDEGAPPAGGAPAFQSEDNKLDFNAADKDTQLRTLAEMMKKKGFGEDRLNKPLVEFSDKERKELFAHLQKQADKETGAFKL